MVTRKTRRERKERRDRIQKSYIKNRRHNMVYAQPGPLEFVIVLDHLKPSFNIGKIFRSADAFGACQVHLVGTEFFDPGPAMGSFKWVPAVFHESFASCHAELRERGYSMFVLEPEDGEVLHRSRLPEKSAFIFGHEEFGISFDKDDFEGVETLRIAQLGRVQSLNVSVAASVVMYEYFRQHGGGAQDP